MPLRIATLANASVVHTQRWVRHLRARGHDVRLYSMEHGPGDLAAFDLPRLVPGPGAIRYPLAVPRLMRELARFEPDLVDAHYVSNYGMMGALAGRHPLSIAAWGSDLLLTARRDPWQRARARFTLGRADLVLCDAENLAQAARTAGAAPGRVRALPWGVDRELFRPAPVREPGLLLSTRMHEPVYDLPTVIEGAARVLETRPDATLVIAGDGSGRRGLEALAASRLPPGRWTFTGMLDPVALASWLARTEVYLSASLSDSTSQSLLEAMAAGAVPVVSDLPGNREWIGDRDGGRLFPAGDSAALARAACEALADSTWAGTARARNAAVIAERGDWHVNLGRIEDWFERLAAGERLP